MQTKKAYIVVGPESSGTRLMTKVLMQAGCEGDSDHYQRFDDYKFNGETPIVWRRSVPHNGRWLRLGEMVQQLHDYDVTVVVVNRNWDVTERSQLGQHTKSIETSRRNIKRAMLEIFGQIKEEDLDFVVVPYESLVLHPTQVQKALWKRLGLSLGQQPISIKDENAKRW